MSSAVGAGRPPRDLGLGEGLVVEGSAISVLLALCGRSVALGELNGPGVETLVGRI